MTDLVATNAPLSEMRVAAKLRTYERIKLALICIVLLTNIVMGSYLIGVANTNKRTLSNGHETLLILRCAVDPKIQFDAKGNLRTPQESRKAFNSCVAAAKKEK